MTRGEIFNSLHDRRFMSQAGERSISREARDEGEGKNKAPVDSPLFWLFRPPTPNQY